MNSIVSSFGILNPNLLVAQIVVMNLALSSAAGTAACAAWRQSPAVNLECKLDAAALGGVSRPVLGLTTMRTSFIPRPAQSLSCEGALRPQNAIATHDLTPPLVRSPHADCLFGHFNSPRVCPLNQSFQLTIDSTKFYSIGCGGVH